MAKVKKKIKDLTNEEQINICNKYVNDLCFNCPLYINAICFAINEPTTNEIKNKEIEVEEK